MRWAAGGAGGRARNLLLRAAPRRAAPGRPARRGQCRVPTNNANTHEGGGEGGEGGLGGDGGGGGDGGEGGGRGGRGDVTLGSGGSASEWGRAYMDAMYLGCGGVGWDVFFACGCVWGEVRLQHRFDGSCASKLTFGSRGTGPVGNKNDLIMKQKGAHLIPPRLGYISAAVGRASSRHDYFYHTKTQRTSSRPGWGTSRQRWGRASSRLGTGARPPRTHRCRKSARCSRTWHKERAGKRGLEFRMCR